jgi:SAM-dependent methyltransferase
VSEGASLLVPLHDRLVFKRRVHVLATHLAGLIPANARVLDVGCGSGDIARSILQMRPDVSIEGIDVLVRGETAIPVREYDGSNIPHDDNSFAVAMFVDVLHHTDDPGRILREAKRVASQAILIKDHFRNGLLAGPTLRFMDWVGNAGHGVRLPYNYLSRAQWQRLWAESGLRVDRIEEKIGLYPVPARWLFERGLHFIARLQPDA